MSVFCGKCDFWDDLLIMDLVKPGNENEELEELKAMHITLGNDKEPTPIKTIKEALKYAPNIVGAAMWYRDSDGVSRGDIYLDEVPYIDRHEKETLEWYFKDIKKLVKKHKRNYAAIKNDSLYKCLSRNTDTLDAILDIVIAKPSATYKSIQYLETPVSKMYRDTWITALIDAGYTRDEAVSWVYRYKNTGGTD